MNAAIELPRSIELRDKELEQPNEAKSSACGDGDDRKRAGS